MFICFFPPNMSFLCADKRLGVWRGCRGEAKGMVGDGWGVTEGKDVGWESAGDGWLAGCEFRRAEAGVHVCVCVCINMHICLHVSSMCV